MVSGSARPTVLVVDDDRPLADLYSHWLAEQHLVYTAYDGETALEYVADLGADLDAILLDRRMPDLSGDLVLVLLRDRGIDCPVAMVTAVDPDVAVLELGFDDYLTKPVAKGELLDAVESLLAVDSLDSVARELSMLRVKRSVLAVELTRTEQVESDEYAGLERRITSLERRLAPHTGCDAADGSTAD